MSSYNNRDISFTDVEKTQIERIDNALELAENGQQSPPQKIEPVPFWTQDLNVILQYPLEFFPSETMSYAQKLNAVTRIVLVFTIIALCYRRSVRLVCVSALTFAAIAYMFYVHSSNQKKVRFSDTVEEGFTPYDNPTDVLVQDIGADTSAVFAKPSANNPFNNVLLSDYASAEHKQPAPPSYTDESKATILEQSKNMIAERNPEQPLINNKLFRSLEDDLQHEQSMRPFYSTANTTIPNDQRSFAEFCYGSMVSCKEGNQFACARNLARHTIH